MSILADKHTRGAASEAQSKSQSSPALSRRELLKGAFVSGASAIVADMGFSRGSSQAAGSDAGVGPNGRANLATTTHPNIVYVFGEQHRHSSWPAVGTAQVQTPNLERLAGQGVELTNCISNYPLCSPHRASLLTGRFPQADTIKRSVGPTNDPLPTTEPSIARALRDDGYATGYVGKWHLYPGAGTLVPPGDHRHGFDDYWRACHRYRYRYDTRTYDDEGVEIVLPGYAPKSQMVMVLGLIQEHASEPFCILLSWQRLHPPFREAPSRFVDLYPIHQIQVQPNVPEDLVDPALPEDHRGYYAHISALDEEIGRLMDKLDQLGIADNTIVAFSSDHGDILGSLGHRAKNRPWEKSINVPFVIRWPAGVPANGRLDVLLSTVDVAPTLLSLAGVPVRALTRGRDLSHVLKGQTGSEPDSALIMSIHPGAVPNDNNVGDWRGVRTLDCTYARRAEEAGVTPWILYDNQSDPYQMTNLINDPGHSDIQAELDGVLSDWLARVNPRRIYMPMVGKTAG